MQGWSGTHFQHRGLMPKTTLQPPPQNFSNFGLHSELTMAKLYIINNRLSTALASTTLFITVALSIDMRICFPAHSGIFLPSILSFSLIHATAFNDSFVLFIYLRGNDLGTHTCVKEIEPACSDNRKRHFLMRGVITC